MDLKNKIKGLAAQYNQEIIQIRRHLHLHPELSFQEFATSEFIQERLKAWGISFKTGIVKTGISGIIEGHNNKNIIALRADMDALPIHEKNDVAYCSLNKGVMHACGHDVHCASLLGTLKILNELKNELNGSVKFIFQPGEEKLPGGASLMIQEGILKTPTVNKIIGQHVYPELEVGKVGFKEGMYMASTDEIYITVKGKGGHGAMPHQNNDPIVIASHIIIAAQQIVSRMANPTVPTVLSFGKIVAEGATNVIPDLVRIEGTFRTMDEKWRKQAHTKLKKIVSGLATSMGAKYEVDIQRGYPYLKNDPMLTNNLKNYAKEYLGTQNVVNMNTRMTAEDFAYYVQEVPGCFYRLGTANVKKGITSPVHSSTFDIDEKAIETGSGLMAWLTIMELNN